ncbi:hypothetical protein KY320_02535 [Candidatus Woesearchaeota archaeon]|nr:hypothetical protein [Candidatus Woesearchaeota archaeon]
MSDDLDQIRTKRLRELQNSYDQQAQQEAEVARQVEALEQLVRQVLTKDALLRYGNIKAADPDKAMQLLVILGRIMQTQKVQVITDAQLKQLLKQITPKKRDFKITRK